MKRSILIKEQKMTNDSVKTKVTAKMSQAEINIIEEGLSQTYGKTLEEIARGLSYRFDKIQDQIKKAMSQLIYIEQRYSRETQKDERIKKVKEILDTKKKLQLEEATKISKWRIRVEAYINETYGVKRRNPNGQLLGYGDRIEIQRKTHLKKLW